MTAGLGARERLILALDLPDVEAARAMARRDVRVIKGHASFVGPASVRVGDRLIEAKRHIPFVQANLIEMPQDDDERVERWRTRMRNAGIWANDPVPLFPYPGSPDYRKKWGLPDDRAWERAHHYYLGQFDRFSDVQNERPRPLNELELEALA